MPEMQIYPSQGNWFLLRFKSKEFLHMFMIGGRNRMMTPCEQN